MQGDFWGLFLGGRISYEAGNTVIKILKLGQLYQYLPLTPKQLINRTQQSPREANS